MPRHPLAVGTQLVHIRLDHALVAALDAEAAAIRSAIPGSDVSRNSLIRTAIHRYLAPAAPVADEADARFVRATTALFSADAEPAAPAADDDYC